MPRLSRYRAPALALAALLGLAGLATAPAAAAQLEPLWERDGGGFAKNWKVGFQAYVPEKARRPDAPVVVLLHGCTQNGPDFARQTGWMAVAEERGAALLVADFQDSYPGVGNGRKCFWWSDPMHRDLRERSQPGAINQAVGLLRQKYNLGKGANYVVGLSAGGAMTAVTLATHPETFSAGAIMAGLPYNCSRRNTKEVGELKITEWVDGERKDKSLVCAPVYFSEMEEACGCMAGKANLAPEAWAKDIRDLHAGKTVAWPRVSIWQGTIDGTVNCNNGSELFEQWGTLHGAKAADLPAGACPTADLSRNPGPREPAKDQRWSFPTSGSGPAKVELRSLHNLRHAVPIADGCGEPGDHFQNAGICAAREQAEFFGIR